MYKVTFLMLSLLLPLILVSTIVTNSMSNNYVFTIEQTTDCFDKINITVIYLHNISISINKSINGIQLSILNNYTLVSDSNLYIEKYYINNTAIYNILYLNFNSNNSYRIIIYNITREIAIILINVRLIYNSSITIPNSTINIKSSDKISTTSYYPYAIIVIISVISTLLLRYRKHNK
ncbi:hypothetical protein [Acidianus brierleyi]|nr:hypothetical protein [Acidianus brierleyi]